MAIYSPYKVMFYPQNLEGTGYPVHVQLIISDLCNQNCHFCAYRMDGMNELFRNGDNVNPKRWIPYSKVCAILDDCVSMNVRAIQVTGGGEPTVHPQHRQIFQDIVARGFEFGLVSNGTRELPTEYDWIRISLDAANSVTYNRIRESDLFDRVVRNIVKAAQLRQADQELGIGFVVTRDNWTEVLDAAKLARDIGVTNFRISAVFQPDNIHYFEGWGDSAEELCLEAETLSGIQVYNLFGNRIRDLIAGPPNYVRCGYQHYTTYIGADLNVYRCCGTSYTRHGLIGSIREKGLRELWDSVQLDDFDARKCARCQFNDRNILIEELRNVGHRGFV
jgi:MoaA/NifB/PqqE/SkfB family radical SAM enzyme